MSTKLLVGIIFPSRVKNPLPNNSMIGIIAEAGNVDAYRLM